MKKTMMQICAAVAAAFIAVKQAHAVAALGRIDDVRVGPLLTTSWAQGDVGGAYCYNYYTPNHYVCGCVATAIAQIMYCHRYPTARIYPGETIYASVNQAGGNAGSWSVGTDGNGSYTLSSGGASTTFDPPYGGPYDWNLMVASPTSGTSENSRKAIGRLTRDAGLAVFADYNVTSGATSGFTRARASSLILNLHYADAVRTGFDANKLIANLDAGLPVLLALTSHEVVADGYGYHNGTLYIHINYGHGGTNSGWYDPTQKILDKNIDDMVANIFPPTRGARHSSIISGRVLNASGNPVANATVTAAGTTTATTTSNAKGIYSFILPAGSYTFTATSGGNSGTLSNCAVEASEQLTRAEVEDPYNDGRWDSGVNKSKSGVDVTIGKSVSENEPDSYLEYVESDSRQWVDLSGLTQTRDITFDADINWTSGGTLIGQNNYGQTLFTAIDGEICCKWYMYEDENGAHTGVRLPSGRHRFVVTGRNNAKLTVSVDGGTPIESAATSSRNDMGTTLSSSLYLFAKHFGGDSSAGDYSSAKLYSLKVYGADGVLAHYYVPALKNSVAGLYDRVNDKWYHSGSGTELIAGPALPPPSALTNPVTADYTLMSDVTINGTLTVNSGATICLNGYKLTVNGLAGDGTITDFMPAAACGELHVVVPSGETAGNSTVAFTGNMKLVVEGGGTFIASKASQSYTGGTVVSSSTTLETRTRTQPFGNNSQTITLKENAVYSVALSDLPGTFQTSCRYNFVLYGGSAIQAGAFNQRRTPLFGTMELLGDASFSLADKAYFGGTSSSHSEITLYGHTLTVTASGGPNMGQVKTLDDGKVSFTAGSGIGMHEANSDFTTATVEYTGTGYAMLGDHGLSTGNLVYNTEKWSSHNVNAVLSVYGTYTAGTHRPPIEMKNGSTLDLSNCVGTLSATGTTSSNGGLVTSNGPLKFASGAAITVVLSGRTDLHTMAKSENPYIVTWASQPNTTFTLDAATGKEFKLEPDGTGIKLIRRDGLSIHLR